MAKDDDVLAKHAESRRAFLAKTAVTSPAVSLLLAQAARPARAQTYDGGETTSELTFPQGTSAVGTSVTVLETSTQITGGVTTTLETTIRITNPTTILLTNPTTIRITNPTTILLTNPTTVRI